MADSQLAQQVTSLAACWRIERPDGVTLGFTSHDQDLWIGSMWYRSRPGISPSAAVADNGFDPAEMEISGVLDMAGLSANDLDSGRWMGALVTFSIVDWQAPESGQVVLFQGGISDVARGASVNGQFRSTIIDQKQELNELKGAVCTPFCRAELGDRRCGVDLSGRNVRVTVAGSSGREIEVAENIDEPENYAFGRLRVMSGSEAGVERRIFGVSGATIALMEWWDTDVEAGDVLRLEEGCDKRLSTCSNRFANARNFSGEPFVPGTDALMRYGEL